MAWDLMPSTQARKLRKLDKETNKIAKNQTNLSVQYSSLTTARDQISATIGQLKVRDFSSHKDIINKMDLSQDYKDKLTTELVNSRDKAVETLVPLLEKAEKLRGNMIVTQEKSLQYLAVIKAQKAVAKAGEIQVEVLTQLQQNGEELANRIEELVSQCETINNITEDAIKPFQNGGADTGKGLLGFNPIVGGK